MPCLPYSLLLVISSGIRQRTCMTLGRIVICPGSKSGSYRLVSVCCFCQPWMAKMDCRENKDFLGFFSSLWLSFYFSYFSIFRSHHFSLDPPISAGHRLPFTHFPLLPLFLSPLLFNVSHHIWFIFVCLLSHYLFLDSLFCPSVVSY